MLIMFHYIILYVVLCFDVLYFYFLIRKEWFDHIRSFAGAIPDGIAVDAENRHVYWTDAGTDMIERVNLDGNNRQIILRDDFQDPRAIVVDPAGQ